MLYLIAWLPVLIGNDNVDIWILQIEHKLLSYMYLLVAAQIPASRVLRPKLDKTIFSTVYAWPFS